MTRYSVQPRDYGFLSSAKNMGRHISQKLSSKYSQKVHDHAKQSAADALKTYSKRVIQKTVESIGDLTGNKIADKVTRSWKTSPQNNLETKEEILRKIYVSSELRQKIIDDLRLKEN